MELRAAGQFTGGDAEQFVTCHVQYLVTT